MDIHDPDFERVVIARRMTDIERLVAYREEFVDSACPACRCSRREPAYDLLGLRYVRCQDCGTIYCCPCPDKRRIAWYLATSESLRLWRDGMPDAIKAKRRAGLYAERADFVVAAAARFGGSRGMLLDAGGGRGEFAEELSRRAAFDRIVVVEPQPLDLAAPRVEVAPTMLEDYRSPYRVDVVTAWEVLEHVVDPDRFLGPIRDLLAPGGLFVFSTPNVDGFETRTLGTVSDALWFDHIRLYNPASVALVLQRNDFELLECATPGRLDAFTVRTAVRDGRLEVSDPALAFLLDAGDDVLQEFQRYLQRTGRSSHMRGVARKGAASAR